jgi:predicted permease
MSPAEADAASRRTLGNATMTREDARAVWISRSLDDLVVDIRYAMRTLLKNPAFSLVVIATLALGIGATTAIFSVVKSVLINPLPYPEPDALVRIVHSIGGISQPFLSDAVYLTYLDNTQTLQDVGVWFPGGTAAITGHGAPEEVRTLTASRGVLTTLGVRPEIGRLFSTADDTPGTSDTVILSHGYWQERFGGDRAVLEQVLTIGGRPHQIVGVMPPDFRFGREFEIVLPLQIDRAAPIPPFRLLAVARLKAGVTLEQANDDAARILRIWLINSGQSDPVFQARYRPSLQPLKQDVVGDVGRTLWILMGAIGLVLLMACANVANLFLVRADAHRQELGIRAALGASWMRIARQLLVESLTFAVLGGAFGVVVAYLGVRALPAMAPGNLPRLSEIAMDPAILVFALTISVMSGLLFGLVPVLRVARPQFVNAIGPGRGTRVACERQGSQQTLVAVQMALALVLMVSAGLMIRTFDALRRVDPGFTLPERVQTFTISIPPTLVPWEEAVGVTRMQQAILDRIAAVPGVASTAFTTRVPMGSARTSSALTVDGRADDARTPANRHAKFVSPAAFRTLGIPLIAGRDFTWTDLYDGRHVAIVSENLARELWGSPISALGKRVREYYDEQSPWREIVGVAGDVHDDGADRPAPTTIYWPAQVDERFFGISGYQPRRITIAIRSERAGFESLLDDVRGAVWSVSGTIPLAQVRTLDDVYGESLARTSFTLVMLGIAATMAVLLGIVGIYGVMSYGVLQRRREIAIRMAIGAQASEIRRLFLRRGIVLTCVGTAIGTAAAAALTRFMGALLFGISPLDPLTFAAVPIVLSAAALLAGYLPARRATKIDPMVALRCE